MSEPTTTPSRPYTSYNLFFQIEREYILQTLLGHTPALAPEDVFDPADPAHYSMDAPPLPPRYADLVLPYDWHVPGKERRRRRRHRKSHGKIGFHELNERISRAWGVAEEEVRDFCCRLSEVEAKKYPKVKKARSKRKKTPKRKKIAENCVRSYNEDRGDVDTKATDPITSEPKYSNFNDTTSHLIDWLVDDFPCISQASFDPDDLSQGGGDDRAAVPLDKLRRQVSEESLALERQRQEREDSWRDSFSAVDMGDDEIIDIWRTLHPEDVAAQSFPLDRMQYCVEVGDGVRGRECGAMRTSFVEAERGAAKEVDGGSPSGTRAPRPGTFKKYAFAARQA